jgi:CheY-like chemotaxis protein
MNTSRPGTLQPEAKHILLVDDDAACRKVLRALLESFGYRVTIASDGSTALVLFSTNPDYYDLVILDQEMPTMDGTAVAEQLVSLCPAVAIMLYTGSGDNRRVMAARAIGIREVVLKPLTIWNLLKAIDRVLESKTAATRGPSPQRHLRLVP